MSAAEVVRSFLPDWAVVVAVSGLVGAVSAIFAVVVYRDTLTHSGVPVEVESAESRVHNER